MIDETAFSDVPPVVWNIIHDSKWIDPLRRVWSVYDSCELGECVTDRRRRNRLRILDRYASMT